MQTCISFMENKDAMLEQQPDSTEKDTRMPNDILMIGCSCMCISHTQREDYLMFVKVVVDLKQTTKTWFWTKSKMTLALRRMLAKNQEDTQFLEKYFERTKQLAIKMATLTSITYMDGILKPHIQSERTNPETNSKLTSGVAF
ncbi:hypothetical protein HHI36_019829 [Cryptolaemus montrouzieri]|uniref:Uncharacterized protein n=1 Tax=Cryptolaemus montrouzieri TaxID=559131 RepID=A0ABD2N8T6_9CUCU